MADFVEEYLAPQLTDDGQEVPDSTPMAIPAGFKRPEQLADQVRRLVRSHLLAEAATRAGLETFEESEDFDVGDDFDPYTPYEMDWDPVLGRQVAPADFLDPVKRDFYKKAYMEAEKNAMRAEARQEAIEDVYRRFKEAQRGVQGDPPAPSIKPPAEAHKAA